MRSAQPDLPHQGTFVRMILLALAMTMTASGALSQKILHEGFEYEILFQAPEIEHPTVVTCDDAGNLFIGEDPMDMRGPSTEEFDRIQYVLLDENGKPSRKTVFADKLSAVFGMVWHDGALYVLHAPHYTMFRDTDGDGVADVRKDLAEGFGPPAGVFGFNDHIVTGTRLGMDGFVYVSVGDKGIPSATGSDGSTLSLEGGGVVRMRLDGSELEVFSTGTRNHLDVAMDSLDNIFTYDNTDDGLGWWTRFTHHIPTGYYGYPYDYLEHRSRHLPAISEHGGGSPVGAACYRGAVWPKKYWDADFHCEWGKRKIQIFFPTKAGATFDATLEDFMVPTEGDDFRPQDNCFSPDGKFMYVADWQYDGWTNPKVAGRVYRVSYAGNLLPEPPRASNEDSIERQIASLGHPAYPERMRAQWELARRGQACLEPVRSLLVSKDSPKRAKIHAIWTLAEWYRGLDAYDPTPDFVKALEDSETDVRAQAARAIGTLKLKGALDSILKRLDDGDPTVRLHCAVALGRIGAKEAAEPLFEALAETDEFARFAMVQALRAIDHWSPAVQSATLGDTTRTQATLLALTGEYDPGAVEALATLAKAHSDPEIRARAIALLSEVHRKAAPYTGGWWGTRPAAGQPSRGKTLDWEGTPKVLEAVHAALEDASAVVRIASLVAQEQVGESVAPELLRDLLKSDPAPEVRIEAMRRLAEKRDLDSVDLISEIAASSTEEVPVRTEAVTTLLQLQGRNCVPLLAEVAANEDTPDPVLKATVEALGDAKNLDGRVAVKKRLEHPTPEIRIAAIDAFGEIVGQGAWISIVPLLEDSELAVRKTALKTLARIRARDPIPKLIEMAPEPDTRVEVMQALNAMPDSSALHVYLGGLLDKNPEVRKLAGESILKVKEKILPDLVLLQERNELSPELRRELADLFAEPIPIPEWRILAAWSKETEKIEFDVTQAPDLNALYPVADRTLEWQSFRGEVESGRILADQFFRPVNEAWLLAFTTLEVEHPYEMHWRIGCDDQATLWINGEKVYEETENGGWSADEGEGKTLLKQGTNLIWIQSGNSGGDWVFSLAVSHYDPRLDFLNQNLAPELDLEAYRRFAQENPGDAAKGRSLFEDPNGIGCVKCHAVGEQGNAQVGPNLGGIGTKFQKEELIRSVLEPSNRIESGYELTLIETVDGEFLDGILRSETEQQVELVNADGEMIRIQKAEIKDRRKSALSAMPNGLEKGMTLQDFADIIAYLESLKEESSGTE